MATFIQNCRKCQGSYWQEADQWWHWRRKKSQRIKGKSGGAPVWQRRLHRHRSTSSKGHVKCMCLSYVVHFSIKHPRRCRHAQSSWSHRGAATPEQSPATQEEDPAGRTKPAAARPATKQRACEGSLAERGLAEAKERGFPRSLARQEPSGRHTHHQAWRRPRPHGRAGDGAGRTHAKEPEDSHSRATNWLF